MNVNALIAFARPAAADLWAFWVLAGLWVGILAFVWFLVRWIRQPDEGARPGFD